MDIRVIEQRLMDNSPVFKVVVMETFGEVLCVPAVDKERANEMACGIYNAIMENSNVVPNIFIAG